MTKRTCKCGKEFITHPSLLKVGKGKYCSKPCYFSVPKSIETANKISAANKGHKWSAEQVSRKRASALRDERHPNWKGDKASYRAVHSWVEVRLGKASKCSRNISHQSTRYHWANISGEYKRDILDWRELCPSCNKNDGIGTPERFKVREAFL